MEMQARFVRWDEGNSNYRLLFWTGQPSRDHIGVRSEVSVLGAKQCGLNPLEDLQLHP